MYEIWIEHKYCGAQTFIYGYSVKDAFKRSKKDEKYWDVLSVDYID